MHDRDGVRQLQLAHAEHIEATYQELASRPGNPAGIEFARVGNTSVYLRNESRLENRAILTGNESEQDLRAIIKLFQKKGVDGFLEVNPGNFYPSDPFSWDSRILPILLKLGYPPTGFRCVWSASGTECLAAECDLPEVRSYTSGDAEEYAELRLMVEPPKPENLETRREGLVLAFTDQWRHYVGFDGDEPVSTSSLFMGRELSYLSWGFTKVTHRRKGHHRAHVIRRATDAFAHGANGAFSVTDFGIPSSLSLQKCGFTLAYNYLMIDVEADCDDTACSRIT
jgi:hypothetical protein